MTGANNSSIKQHYLVLDSFRGLCACIVALSHFNANSIFRDSPLFYRGSIYVDFFFVLSGFVIFANYEEKLKSGYGLGKFILLRLGCLYPLHFAVLMAFIAVDLFQMLVHIDGAALYAPFSAPGETPGAIVANLLLIHSLHVTDTLAFNGPSWSISVEFYAYIFFALILIYAGKNRTLFIAAVTVASAAMLSFLHEDLYAKLDYGFLRCVFGFGCGALTWKVFQKFSGRIQPWLQNAGLVNLTEVGFFVAMLVYIQFFSFDALSFVAPLVFSLAVLIFAFEAGRLSGLLKAKPFLLLGMLSYSIYMIHIFVSGKLFALPVRLLEGHFGWDISVEIGGVQLYGTNLAAGTLLELFYLIVVVGFSCISYKLIEEPCRNWTKNFVYRRCGRAVAHAA